MITSSQNERVKQLRKLRDKKHRDATGLFAAEGEDLVRSALAAGREPVEVFCAPGAPADVSGHARAVAVESGVLDAASALGSGSKVIGVFESAWADASAEYALAVYLDGIADPGNVGTVLRSVLAFADGPAILGPGCADPFAPKAVRASMGAVFSRPPARVDEGFLAGITARRVALDGDAEMTVSEVAGASRAGLPTVICVGAERGGLSPETLAAADITAAIPMLADGPESLNAAIAASIALYELGSGLRAELQTAVHSASESASATGKTATNEK